MQLHGKAHNILRKLRTEYDAALEQVDILVMPTTPWVAKVMLVRACCHSCPHIAKQCPAQRCFSLGTLARI